MYATERLYQAFESTCHRRKDASTRYVGLLSLPYLLCNHIMDETKHTFGLVFGGYYK